MTKLHRNAAGLNKAHTLIELRPVISQETLAKIDTLSKNIEVKSASDGQLSHARKSLRKLRAIVRRALENGGKVERGTYIAKLVKLRVTIRGKRKTITRLRVR